jgi:hypothetical protein
MYQPDPAAIVERFARFLKPGVALAGAFGGLAIRDGQPAHTRPADVTRSGTHLLNR